MAFGITNFNGAALDQQLFAVDRRIAQSTSLNGNLFGALGGAQQSGLDAVFGGLGSLNFGIPGQLGFQAPGGIGFPDPGRIGFQAPSPLSLPIPQTIGFAQNMLGSLGALSNGWAGMLGGGGYGGFGGGTRSCH